MSAELYFTLNDIHKVLHLGDHLRFTDADIVVTNLGERRRRAAPAQRRRGIRHREGGVRGRDRGMAPHPGRRTVAFTSMKRNQT